MKKIILAVLLFLLVLPAAICRAGSIPEDLLSSDSAQLYLAEVLEYHQGSETTVVTPVKNIKGDIVIGSKQTLENSNPVGKRDINPKKGELCLIAYYDEINPIYIFKVTDSNIPTLKIKNVEGFEMWERLQEYINEGAFTEAEVKRVAGNAAEVSETPKNPFLLSPLYGMEAVIISLALVLLSFILGFVKNGWSKILRIVAGSALALYGLVAAGFSKHYFSYKLYEKWGDNFDSNIREFILWAIAKHSQSMFLVGTIVISLITMGSFLLKSKSKKYMNNYTILSFMGVNILGFILGIFTFNKMFDVAAYILAFSYFTSLWLFCIPVIKSIKNER